MNPSPFNSVNVFYTKRHLTELPVRCQRTRLLRGSDSRVVCSASRDRAEFKPEPGRQSYIHAAKMRWRTLYTLIKALRICPTMSTSGYDVVIVGAGIVGAACADELARRGKRVAVLDRDVIGSGATAAGMGHIVVMDDSEAQFALTRYSQRLWQALRPDLPDDIEYQQCGTIWVAADEEEMAEVRRKHQYYWTRGVPTEMLDAATVKKLEPNLRDGMAGGLLVPEDGVL